MKPSTFLVLLLLVLMVMTDSLADLRGTWEILVENAGISSMHTAVTRFNTVVLIDRINRGPQNTTECKLDQPGLVIKPGCYYQSVIFDLRTNILRPLKILTDTWCSSGQFQPNGTLIHTGGDGDGLKKIRTLKSCDEAASLCDWVEKKQDEAELREGRWYSTNQILPDGSIIIVGGRGANSIEYLPPKGPVVNFPFLAETADSQLDNLYPYVHLLPNGHLFVFANKQSILYDYLNNIVLKQYPQLEGGPRNYPSAGSSVMLALTGDYSTATIVVCGGAQFGAFKDNIIDSQAQGSCGRIEATSMDPKWEMEDMPFVRIMGEMVMLPTGDVLIINGAQAGSQGFEIASKPCLNPVLYKPNKPIGQRFTTLNPSSVPRMYHSTANLLPDGRILIAGSNPHSYNKFDGEFPTELKIEAFSPEYLSTDKDHMRPTISLSPWSIVYGISFQVRATTDYPLEINSEVNIASAPFSTHSFSQGQRLVKISILNIYPKNGEYVFDCKMSGDQKVAPPGYYMIFVVNAGVPSVAKWVRLDHYYVD